MKNRLWIIGIAIAFAMIMLLNRSEGVSSSPAVSTIAGQKAVSGSTDGSGANARFSFSCGVTTDGTNLYVADAFNHTIRKVVISTAEVTTLAGTAGVSGSVDGTRSAARFNSPHGITTDGVYLYVADTNNHIIRKIDISTGMVLTLAGTAGVAGSTDGGIGLFSQFSSPYGITTDGTNLYVTDTWNSTIRKIVIGTGETSTLAGSAGSSGSSDGIGAAGLFSYPLDIATDGTNLYVVDNGNQTVRKVTISTGEVSTLAGSVGVIGSNDGVGGTAFFNYPQGITTDGVNVYVADKCNNTIRKIDISSRQVSTLAGMAGRSGFDDGNAANARFGLPFGITSTTTSLFITDMGTIRKIE